MIKKGKMRKKVGAIFATLTGFAFVLSAFLTVGGVKASAETLSERVNYTGSYFKTEENSSIETDVSLPKYIAAKKNGVKITQSKAGEKVVYDKEIDVSDMTKDDLLCELAITPNVAGKLEFNKLVVRLEDAENPKVFVEINLSTNTWSQESIRQYVEMSAKTNTISSARGAFYGGFVDTDKITDTNGDGKITYEDVTTRENGLGTLVGSTDADAIAQYEAGRLQTKSLWDRVLNSDGTYNKVRHYKSMSGVSGYYRSIASNFAGSGLAGYSNTVKLYYDNAEKAVYYGNSAAWPLGCLENSVYDYGEGSDTKVKLLDMDDFVEMGNNARSVWTGFPSGKVKMSFSASSFEGENAANYTILTIDNQGMGGVVLQDVNAPDLQVDLQGYDKSALPSAIYGKAYPLFDAVAVDAIDGVLPVQVIADGALLPREQDYWIPTAGKPLQTLTYRATDRSGNTVEKTFTVSVNAELSELKGILSVTNGALDFTDESQKDAQGNYSVTTYCPVILPSMTGEGGSGDTKVEVSVVFNGNPVEMSGNSFIPKKEGSYTVCYKVSDYIGQTVEYEFKLKSSYQEKILLTTPCLPRNGVIGNALFFPSAQAVYYTAWGQRVNAYTEIRIYKEDGESLITTFKAGEFAKYKPTGDEGERLVVEYLAGKNEASLSNGMRYTSTVPLVKMEQISDLLIEDGEIEKEVSTLETVVKFKEEGATVEFAYPLSVMGDGLTIRFSSSTEMKDYDRVEFTFTDYLDSTRLLKVAFSTETGSRIGETGATVSYGYVSVNFDELNPAWLETTEFVFGDSLHFTTLRVTQNGEVYLNDERIAVAENFVGFSSGRAYVRIGGYGVDTDEAKVAGITLSQINGDIVNNSTMDFKLPILQIGEKLGSSADLGTYFNLPSALATDVFCGSAKITVSVVLDNVTIYRYSNENGEFKGDKIFLSTYGEYVVIYEAVDGSNRTFSTQYKVRVRDKIAPNITVHGEVNAQAKAGEKLQMPKATAKDNADGDLTVYVIIIDPMNVYTVLEQGEEYVFTKQGRYFVKYYCEDDNYNAVYSKEYQITVK